MTVTYGDAVVLLGLTLNSKDTPPTVEEVRRAFRQEALKWHPDKQRRPGTDNPIAADGLPTDSEAAPAADSRSTGAPAGSAGEPNTTNDAGERFKRLAAAYHVVLQAAAGSDGSTCSSGGGGGGPPMDDDELADAVSAQLLMEASKLRLSDFDMMFLHQRACGGTALASTWPESAQSLEDIWRRIRRRVERRRKRQGARCSRAVGEGPGSATAESKWVLLFEFVAGVVGADAGDSAAAEAEPPDSLRELQPGSERAGTCRDLERSGCVWGHTGPRDAAHFGDGLGDDDGRESMGVASKDRGRLPPGFYWRWIRRVVAATVLFNLFLKP